MESSKLTTIYLASDHAGFELKEQIKTYLLLKNFEVSDLGPFSADRCDYPDFSEKLCSTMQKSFLENEDEVVSSMNSNNLTTKNKQKNVDSEKLQKSEISKKIRPKCKGILVCGSGIGISIAANKFKGIRCGLVHDEYTTKNALFHNNCNVIAMGGRIIGEEITKRIVDLFLSGEGTVDVKEEEVLKRIEEKYCL